MTIGQLLIEIKAKTDAFERGMKSAKDLSFATAGDIVNSLEKIGGSLGKMHFGSIDQATKSLGILGGIAAGTGVALATTLLVVAEKTADRIHEMGENALKAGMDVKSFSEYAYAFKVAGVPLEAFTTGMSMLAKNALQAAEGNQKLQQAFKMAGTSATDANGHLRPTSAILDDIIKKYDSLSNATLRVALARQLFGRGGTAFLPGLDKGPEWIAAMRQEADRLGVAIDENLLKQSEAFREGQIELKAFATGAATQFTAGLLPALNQVLQSITQVTGNASAMRDFGDTVGDAFRSIAKAIYEAVFAWQYWKLKTEGTGRETKSFAQDVASVFKPGPRLLTPDEKSHFYDFGDATEAAIQEAERKRDERINALYAPPTTGKGHTPTGPDPAITNINNQLADRIAKLKAQVDAEAKLATSIGDSTSATLLNTAAVEAQKTIDELNAAGKSKNIRLTEEQANSVRRLTTMLASYKEAVSANKELEDSIEKTMDATKQTLNLASAYDVGAEAVKKAEEQAKTAPFAEHISDLESTIARLKQMGTRDKDLAPLIEALDQAKRRLESYIAAVHAASLAQQEMNSTKWGDQIRFDTTQLEGYADAIRQGTAALHAFNIEQEMQRFRKENPNLPEADYDARRRELTEKDLAQQRVASAEYENRLNIQTESLRSYTDAVLGGAAALRQFNVEQQMQQFQRENPNLPASEYDARRRQLQENAELEARNAAAEHVHALERYKDLDDEIRQLQRIREQQQLAGQPTTATDQAIRSAQNESAINRAETGGIGAGIRGGLAQLNQEWGSWGRQAMQSTSNALHGMQSSFSSFFHTVAMGTKTIGQAFAQLGIDILGSIVGALDEMVARWITTHVVMAAIHLIFKTQELTQDATAAATKVGITSAANTLIALSDAGLAAAGAFAYYSATAPEIALPMAMAQYAEGLSLVGLASAAGGMEVDRDQLALVHKNEKILPARISQGFDRIINNYSTTNNGMIEAAQKAGQASQPNLPPITIHVNGAGDPNAVATKVSDITMARVKRYLRTAGVSR